VKAARPRFSVPGEKGRSRGGGIHRPSLRQLLSMCSASAAAMGRLLTPDDNVTEGAHPLTVISWDLWQRRFGGEAGILGALHRAQRGALQDRGCGGRAGFHGTSVGITNDLYVPIVMMPHAESAGARAGIRGTGGGSQ